MNFGLPRFHLFFYYQQNFSRNEKMLLRRLTLFYPQVFQFLRQFATRIWNVSRKWVISYTLKQPFPKGGGWNCFLLIGKVVGFRSGLSITRICCWKWKKILCPHSFWKKNTFETKNYQKSGFHNGCSLWNVVYMCWTKRPSGSKFFFVNLRQIIRIAVVVEQKIWNALLNRLK